MLIKRTRCLRIIGVLVVFTGGMQIELPVHASNLDLIGVKLLRQETTNVNGMGIRVAQPEAGYPSFEVNPTNNSVQQATGLFTYITSNGTASYFPNSLGTKSAHADTVAAYFYGPPDGVATNVAHVDDYDANYFVNDIIVSALPSNIGDSLVNQSFTFGSVNTNTQKTIDSDYDNYADQYNVLFVSAADNAANSTRVSPPGTSYNCICVGAYLDGVNYSSVGPTLDNGRAKPDITAPADATSFSTPQVAGAAALLMQAGRRGDGGNNTNAAADMRTIKALLLNGAVKPADWANNPPSPLDPRYGAGILNVFNSYEQLAGGQHGYIVATSVPAGNPHPPAAVSSTIGLLSGWDFNTNTSSANSDEINHYYFNVTNDVSNATFAATATLVWNRHQNQTGINNLNLFLYNAADSNLVASSTSVVDNVEHIFVPNLSPGRYDLQVWKAGGIQGVSIVSFSETYALAWEFSSTFLTATPSGGHLRLFWPIYPDGFVLASATSLVPPIVWNKNQPAPFVTNGEDTVQVRVTNTSQFFRLQPP